MLSQSRGCRSDCRRKCRESCRFLGASPGATVASQSSSALCLLAPHLLIRPYRLLYYRIAPQTAKALQHTNTLAPRLPFAPYSLHTPPIMPCEDPCKPQACLIQDCLTANNYNESNCTKVIDNLYICCKKWYEANGTDKTTTCCPKFNLLQLKLKQRELGQIDAQMIDHKQA